MTMVKSRTIGLNIFYHVGTSQHCNSIPQSGLAAGGKDSKEGRQTVFFTAVDPMNEPQRDEPYEVKEPR